MGDLEWTSARSFGVSPEGPGERILATVLFTDIVDSTANLERIGDAAWRDVLDNHNRLLREDLNLFRGREVSTTGDGFLAVFDGATRPSLCVAMTRSAQRAGLAIRVGLHTGEVEMVGSNARGLAVHAAARVMCLLVRARCSSRRRRRTCWRAPTSHSRMPERTS